MIDKMATTGSYVAFAAGVLCLITGQFLIAAVAFFIAVWGLKSRGKPTAVGEIIESGVDIPPVDQLRRFREEHPDLSFSEAILAMQKKRG